MSIAEQSRREVRVIGVAGWLLLLAMAWAMTLTWTAFAAGLWILQASALWGLVYYQTTGKLHLNRRETNSNAFLSLGLANRLTIFRGLLISMTGGFLFQSWPAGWLAWLPGVFYMTAAIIDRIDGYVARRTHHQSLMGVELDTIFDALGLAVAPLLAVWYGQIHWSYLLVSFAYYLFRRGMDYRQRHNLPLYPLLPSLSRRAIAGFQMGYVAVVLLPVFKPPVTVIAGFAFMIPLLTGFVIDWLLVTGKLGGSPTSTALLADRIRQFSFNFCQPGLRLLIVFLSFVTIRNSALTLSVTGYEPLQHPCLKYGLGVAMALILLGVAGRVGALMLLCLLGWFYLYHRMNVEDYILLFGVVWLMLLGTGRFSLWRWDDTWINRYDGSP